MPRPIPPHQIENPEEIFVRLKEKSFLLKGHPTREDIECEMAEALDLQELSQEVREHLEAIITCYSLIENYQGEGKRLTEGITPAQTVAAIDYLLKAQDRYKKTLQHKAATVISRWPKVKGRYINALKPFTLLESTIDADTIKDLMPFAIDCLSAIENPGDDFLFKMQQLSIAAKKRRDSLVLMKRIDPEVEHARCVACLSKLVFEKFAVPAIRPDDHRLRKFVISCLMASSIPHGDYIEHPARLTELLENCSIYLGPFLDSSKS